MKGNSIITADWDHCFICGTTQNLQEHHVFPGTANRKQSEKYKMSVPLCVDCHTGSSGVHNNTELKLRIQQLAQIEFEKHFSFEEFMKVIGKNYR